MFGEGVPAASTYTTEELQRTFGGGRPLASTPREAEVPRDDRKRKADEEDKDEAEAAKKHRIVPLQDKLDAFYAATTFEETTAAFEDADLQRLADEAGGEGGNALADFIRYKIKVARARGANYKLTKTRLKAFVADYKGVNDAALGGNKAAQNRMAAFKSWGKPLESRMADNLHGVKAKRAELSKRGKRWDIDVAYLHQILVDPDRNFGQIVKEILEDKRDEEEETPGTFVAVADVNTPLRDTIDVVETLLLRGSSDKILALEKKHELFVESKSIVRIIFSPDSLRDLTSITTLDLSGCISLTSLPNKIGDLVKLSTLNLQKCESLNSLPERVKELNLTKVYFDYCKHLDLDLIFKVISNFKGLTELGLQGLEMESIPDRFGECTSLTTLDLYSCANLASLPDSIGDLKSLIELELGDCYQLTSLPERIGDLKALTKLILSFCEKLVSLPDSIGQCESLTLLSLQYCGSLVSLPDSIGQCKSLTELNLNWCTKLVSLPDRFGGCESLTSLNLNYCTSLVSLPDSIGDLTSLKTLNLQACTSLVSLPEGFEKLKNLDQEDFLNAITHVNNLPVNIDQHPFAPWKDVDSVCHNDEDLVTREELDTWFEHKGGYTITVRPLNGNGQCFPVTMYYIGMIQNNPKVWLTGADLNDPLGSIFARVVVKDGKLVFDTSALYTFENLEQRARIYDAQNYLEGQDVGDQGREAFKYQLKQEKTLPEEIVEHPYLKDEQVLDISYNEKLVLLPERIGELSDLTSLNLENCTSLVSLPDSIGDLTNLKELYMTECTSLVSLPERFGECKSLTKLDLSWCENLESLPDSIGDLTSLSELNLYNCRSLVSLPKRIGDLTSLTELNLFNCPSLPSLPERFGELNLTKLVLGNTPLDGAEETYAILGEIPTLTELTLSSSKIKSLPERFGECNSLTKLDLKSCQNLESLPHSIGECKSLTSLDVGYCKSLVSLPDSIGKLTSLTKLTFYDCKSFKSLPESIGNLSTLKELSLTKSKFLKSLPESIGSLTALKNLECKGCKQLESLPRSIGKLSALNEIHLDGCKSLMSLPKSIENLTALKILNLNVCKKLDLGVIFKIIFKYKNLTELNLGGLNMQSLPRRIGDLEKLTALTLSNCRSLVSLPKSITKLKNLERLFMHNCTSLESLPEKFGDLSALEELHFSNCKSLESFPQSIKNLKSLSELRVGRCPARFSMPDSLKKHTHTADWEEDSSDEEEIKSEDQSSEEESEEEMLSGDDEEEDLMDLYPPPPMPPPSDEEESDEEMDFWLHDSDVD